MSSQKQKETKQTEPTFTKAQFLASEQFSAVQIDFLSAILEDDKTYTVEQVNHLIEEKVKKAVN